MLAPYIQDVVQPLQATVGAFQSDFDAQYWTLENKKLLQPGTRIQRSPPHTQKLNGTVEQRIGTIKDAARVLMTANEAPALFRPWALEYANVGEGKSSGF